MTLNLNGIKSLTRVDMFHRFVQSNSIDILFLQEVVSEEVLHMPGYALHCNLGTEMRGTAFLLREGIRLNHVEKLPSGRAIAAVIQGILLVNLYATSGTARKAEREAFYSMDLPFLLRNEVSHVMLSGDFNCVMDPCDVTGQ
jgi:exonuclease III